MYGSSGFVGFEEMKSGCATGSQVCFRIGNWYVEEVWKKKER